METYKKLDKREFIEVYQDYLIKLIESRTRNQHRQIVDNSEYISNITIKEEYEDYLLSYEECNYNYLLWVERRSRNGNL